MLLIGAVTVAFGTFLIMCGSAGDVQVSYRGVREL